MSVSSDLHETVEPGPYGPGEHSPWLDVDWREHQRWVMVEDQPLNVIELGEGPPLVFIHGLIGRWTHWVEQLTAFAPHHRVIALDLPGFGHSPSPSTDRISVPYYARLVAKLLAAIEVDAAAVIGHSMGGFTAVELSINFPQLVERLVLVSPAGLSTYNDPRVLRLLSQARRLERLLSSYGRMAAGHAHLLARRPRLRLLEPNTRIVTRHPDRLPPEYVLEFVRGLGTSGFVDGIEANVSYDYRERLMEVACPTLIVWGTQDKVVTSRDAEDYQRLISNASKVLFEDTGHMAMIERPVAFNELLERFLEDPVSS
ncbi:MAG: alpha/beta fold hydrolase [Solirubrobacteraceae bacterium]